MRIDGESSGSPLFGRRPVRPGAAGGSRRTSSAAQPASTGAARENSELMSKLQELPEIRADVLEDVRQRLQRGELLTREAAEETANAILSDLQAFLRL